MNALDRFRILNNCLGYGNTNAKIIHFSLLEEHGDWSIPSLAKMLDNYKDNSKEIEKIYCDVNLKVKEKIDRINHLLNTNLTEVLNYEVEKYKELTFNILKCDPTLKQNTSPTVDFQFAVSKFIINELKPDFKLNEVKFESFGTKDGNEICINFNPIGKSTTKKPYEEYNLFFGLGRDQSFPDRDCYSDRLNLIKTFLNQEVDLKHSYLIVYGGDFLKSIINDITLHEFEVIGLEESSFSADTDKRVWWLYHPAARGNKKPISVNIPYIFKPLISDQIRMRIESKK